MSGERTNVPSDAEILNDAEAADPSIQWRDRAVTLQCLLGFQVSAATSNGWLGAYCIVDFDPLWKLAKFQREVADAIENGYEMCCVECGTGMNGDDMEIHVAGCSRGAS